MEAEELETEEFATEQATTAGGWYARFRQEYAELALQPPSTKKILEVVYNV